MSDPKVKCPKCETELSWGHNTGYVCPVCPHGSLPPIEMSGENELTPGMKNKADYSKYRCPFAHLPKDCGHELKGPEGYADTYSVWCECGFRGPVFYLEPEELGLQLKGATPPGYEMVPEGTRKALSDFLDAWIKPGDSVRKFSAWYYEDEIKRLAPFVQALHATQKSKENP